MNGRVLYVLLLFFSVFISAVSHILLKKAAMQKYTNFIFEYLNAKVIVAYVLFFTAVFIDLFALKYVPLSFVPVIEMSSYVFVFLLSRMFLDEKFSRRKIAGMTIVLIGILVYVL